MPTNYTAPSSDSVTLTLRPFTPRPAGDLSLYVNDFGPGLLAGYVTDADGNPVEGATVEAVEDGVSNAVTAQTDAYGEYRFFFPSGGTYHVSARARPNDAALSGVLEPSLSIDRGSTFPTSGVARYTFDTADTSSGTAIDSWNGNDATINGATVGASGANQTYTTNEAYSFTSGDDVTTPVDDNLDITFGCWINPDESVGNGTVIQTSSGTNGCGIRNDGGTFNGFVRANGTWYTGSGGTLSVGSWHHVVGVVDGGNLQLLGYVDGSEVFSTGTANRSGDLGGVGKVNTGPVGTSIAQDVDDVRFYHEALTATEVSNWYNTGSVFG